MEAVSEKKTGKENKVSQCSDEIADSRTEKKLKN